MFAASLSDRFQIVSHTIATFENQDVNESFGSTDRLIGKLVMWTVNTGAFPACVSSSCRTRCTQINLLLTV